jgi:hypothetical protein
MVVCKTQEVKAIKIDLTTCKMTHDIICKPAKGRKYSAFHKPAPLPSSVLSLSLQEKNVALDVKLEELYA